MKISSYLSPKAKRVVQSEIAGHGLVCVEPIKKGEIVIIKGGHIVDLKKFESEFEPVVGMSILQIDDNFVIGPVEVDEIETTVVYLNHSCDPNVGLRGEITFIAMRDINPDEEIVTDYAMIQDNDESMDCNCGSVDCRKMVTGKDWKIKELQEKYRNYFAAFLLQKIDNISHYTKA